MMDGVPVEVIAEGFTVSYAPSASLFAQQKGQARPKTSGLVALGDPIFQRARQAEPPLPPGGVLLTAALPGSIAAHADCYPATCCFSMVKPSSTASPT